MNITLPLPIKMNTEIENFRRIAFLWWMIYAIRVYAPRPRQAKIENKQIKMAGSRSENMLISGGTGRRLRNKLRPALPLISAFSSCDPALLFIKSRSASTRGKVSFIKLRPAASLIGVFSFRAPAILTC
jgi:hypothetical protein